MRHILNLVASEWIDDSSLVWLNSPPNIGLLSINDIRKPYSLNWEKLMRVKTRPAQIRQESRIWNKNALAFLFPKNPTR